jgi:ZIP family zinc transporter
MSEFLLVVLIASIAAFLTYLGAPAAERFDVPHRVISAALQFAAGVLTAVVALSLIAPAAQLGSIVGIVLAFFVGGALFITFDYFSAKRQAATPTPAGKENAASLGFYFGILVDMAIDGVVIGIASTLTLQASLLLALGIVISTAPLAFVTTATAKRQGVPKATRRTLSYLYLACMVGGALFGYLLLRNQSEPVRAAVIALASGFLFTTITQSMIPEANREGEPSFAGVLYVGGIALYTLLTLSGQ